MVYLQGLCPRATKEKGWKPLLWGQNHIGETLWPWGNTHRSPIMGKYLPTAGAGTGNQPQLNKLPAWFISHFSVCETVISSKNAGWI